CRLLCSYAASYADYDIWNNDDSFLCALQHCRQYFGIPPCAENFSAENITGRFYRRKSIKRNGGFIYEKVSQMWNGNERKLRHQGRRRRIRNCNVIGRK